MMVVVMRVCVALNTLKEESFKTIIGVVIITNWLGRKTRNARGVDCYAGSKHDKFLQRIREVAHGVESQTLAR
jgi:hypothetical protein